MELSQAKLKYFHSLLQKKNRTTERLFIAEGLKTIADLIQNNANCEAIIIDNAEIDEQKLSFIPANTTLYTTKQIHKLSSQSSPAGIIGVFKMPNSSADFSFKSSKWTLILDNINDPGNMGTVIRTAHWFNIQNIILFGNCTDIYAPKVVQSTMGSLLFPHFYTCFNEEEFTNTFHQKDKKLFVTSLEGKPINDVAKTSEGYLVLGSESHGVQPFWEQLENASSIYLPFQNEKSHPESLNVATAGAIFMHHFIS